MKKFDDYFGKETLYTINFREFEKFLCESLKKLGSKNEEYDSLKYNSWIEGNTYTYVVGDIEFNKEDEERIIKELNLTASYYLDFLYHKGFIPKGVYVIYVC